jgi:membrane associated rhomboid family serine protease
MSGGQAGASGERVRYTGLDGGPVGAGFPSPIAACALAAVLFLAFAAQWWGSGIAADRSGYAVYLVGGLHASSVLEGEVFRLVTAPLLHLNVHHLGFNLTGLLAFGAALEAQVGHARFILVVALSMLAGSIAAVAVPPEAGVLLGASGGLFGTIGAMATLVLREWQSPSPLLRRARWVLPIALAGDAALVLLVPERVGWSAHLGGFAGGVAAMALLSRGAGPIPLGRSSRWIRLAAAGLAALFLWGVAADVERIASGRVCEVLERDDLSTAVRDGLTAALRDLPVACADLEP